MDEPKAETTPTNALKEWVTPDLIVEDVQDVTRGGRGDERLLAREDKITIYYHS